MKLFEKNGLTFRGFTFKDIDTYGFYFESRYIFKLYRKYPDRFLNNGKFILEPFCHIYLDNNNEFVITGVNHADFPFDSVLAFAEFEYLFGAKSKIQNKLK